MDSERELEQARRKAGGSPTAWFTVLEYARSRQDFALAATALRELNGLGVKVRYSPRRQRQDGKGVADAR